MKQYSVVLFLLAVASIPFDAIVNLGFVRISSTEVLFSIAFFASSVDIVRARQQILSSPMFVPIVLFLITCGLSLVNSSNVVITLREVIQFGWLFAIFYMVAVKSADDDLYSPTYAVLTVVAAVVSIAGAYQYFFISEPVHFQVAGLRLRAHGFYDQPNTLGSFLIGVIPLLVVAHLVPGTIAAAKGKLSGVYSWLRRKWTILILYAIGSTGLIMSFSRGSWLGCICAVFLVAFFVRRMNLLKGLILPIGIVVLIAAIIFFDVSVQPKKVDREFSNSQRALLLQASLGMFKDYPILGIGLGNFPIRLTEYAPDELKQLMLGDYDPVTKRSLSTEQKELKIELVHNMFLQVATETGIVGLLAFLFVIIQFYRSALTRIRRATIPEEKMRYVAPLAGVTAIFIGGVFGWPFSHGVQEVLIVLMALAVA